MRTAGRGGALVAALMAAACATGPPQGGAPAASRDERGGDTLRVVAYNIKHGRGMDGEIDLPRIAEVLRRLDPDVVALQEVDDATERSSGVDQAGRLAELLGMRGLHGPHRPYQGGLYGNAVLTRLPVLEERTHPIPSRPGAALTVHEVRVAVGSALRPVSVVSVHLAGTAAERLAQADSVTSLFADDARPVVLAGDFNGRPEGPVVGRLGRDWHVLRKEGAPVTFPSEAPDREIDFVMLGPAARFRAGAFEVVEHRVIEEAVASDHRPILAVVVLR